MVNRSNAIRVALTALAFGAFACIAGLVNTSDAHGQDTPDLSPDETWPDQAWPDQTLDQTLNQALVEDRALIDPSRLAALPGVQEQTVSPTIAWYQRFSLAERAKAGGTVASPFDYSLELGTGHKWGFAFDYERDRSDTFDLEAVRAGAFFDFNPRLRFGGELSYSTEFNFDFQLSTPDEDEPEVKFKSAFRF